MTFREGVTSNRHTGTFEVISQGRDQTSYYFPQGLSRGGTLDERPVSKIESEGADAGVTDEECGKDNGENNSEGGDSNDEPMVSVSSNHRVTPKNEGTASKHFFNPMNKELKMSQDQI